ncbi:uncharacterized protein CcaverHIS019_0607380 [Cutaneotrichosporon cavernicola]|uniref:Uncharacterized protein n=1 Tax=Cutaneotrichosporon cavernicola TaxID=279322 RepID=A0AA48L937_9TREE|nr:uncharacterized protein CcaverHIS019_0607380 [Cutaneotrichosporon cavernicola]BEI94279.1 hypothetical protein CcaverHIS019_0607380 [Cutaneotrichosporon cavernicola]BEJ02057.1 hypothetical protein CcaverHIS631_0607390 [Cutaneotrichosporon cavernicola]BEJ09818.1 hypothetical protein CcaverHIS641_0607330 [Cutaneotrichosporon cavernicola]
MYSPQVPPPTPLPPFPRLPPLRFPRRTNKAPTPLSPRIRTGHRDYPACIEAGISHEARSQALGHVGPSSGRHLRAAAAHFKTALALQPGGGAELRLATVLYHLSAHFRPAEAGVLLRIARALATGDGPALEVRAAICARLSALLRMPADDLNSEAGEAAVEALDAFEDVAAERMDRASTLSKANFELEAPALAATFLALAEAAAAVSTLSDPKAAEPHAKLADHALTHAGNMATLARAPALLTHIQIVGARIATNRLAYYTRWDDVSWDDLIADLATLASQTRDLAQRLRGSRGATAAEQAAEAAKLLADARVMHASALSVFREPQPSTPGIMSPRSAGFAISPVSATLATPQYATFSPPDPTPGLVSSSGSWSSSTSSPPIPEEPEEEDLAPAIPDPASVILPRKRAPPPPPLILAQRSPRPLMQSLSPQNPPLALSPLNPARQAMRPPLLRSPSLDDSPNGKETPLLPSQVQWNELAIAGKGYKLALSLLSGANLAPYECARRKSDLLFAIASAALARAELAPRLTPMTARNSPGSYFSPTAPHASPESLCSLRLMSYRTYTRASTYPRSSRIVPATPRPDPRSGMRTTGEAALRATAEVYAAWAAREVGWSAVIDPKGRVVDRRTGSAAADEAGLRAVLLAVRVWWIRAVAGDGDGEPMGSDEEIVCESPKAGSWDSDSDSGNEEGAEGTEGAGTDNHDFGVPPHAARRIAGVLYRLRAEGAGGDDVRRFVASYSLRENEECFWTVVESLLE